MAELLRKRHRDATREEKEFCVRWLDNIATNNIISGLYSLIAITLVYLIVGPTLGNHQNWPFWIAGGVVFVSSIALLPFKRNMALLNLVIPVGWILFSLLFAISIYTLLYIRPDYDIALKNFAWYGIASIVTTVILDDRSLRSPLAALFFSILAVVLFSAGNHELLKSHNSGVWLFAYSWVHIIVQIVFIAIRRRDRDSAMREYKFRSRIAPAHIVRKSGPDTEDLEDLLKPNRELCFCISSDWRNYQKLTAETEPEHLTAALNEYYDICEEILTRLLPQGNFFSDWIADELFVVIFAEGTAEVDTRLANTVISVGSEIVQARKSFHAKYGLPEAIDVGISFGEAFVGLMGPKGFRKATALGETPGRARRLQTAGKILRMKLGESDRVIFGSECIEQLFFPFDIQKWTIEEGIGLRDLADKELFYIEPLKVSTTL